MRVLVIGSGGREHALCWRLKQSSSVSELFAAPGNPGMADVAQLVALKVDQIEELCDFAAQQNIDLTVVGPEFPLTLGLTDAFRARGLRVLGPTRAAAKLEESKSFAKEIMRAAGAPTADAWVFEERAALESFLAARRTPLVLKADGLAGGKGVFVCQEQVQLAAAVRSLFEDLKTTRVVVEEYLDGVEASLIVATDGTTVVPLAPAHDYKRIFDQDRGPNTGGMGTVSPTPRLSEAQMHAAIESIIQPVLREMKRLGEPFQGFLYAGLMIGRDGAIRCLEFNVRLGDPECQVIMRRFKGDLARFFVAVCDGTLAAADAPKAEWLDQTAVCVVLAAAGYPELPELGDRIDGLEHAAAIPGAVVFHAGTKRDSGGSLVTAGGRVLNVTGIGSSITEARRVADRAADLIQFRGLQRRRDIGLN